MITACRATAVCIGLSIWLPPLIVSRCVGKHRLCTTIEQLDGIFRNASAHDSELDGKALIMHVSKAGGTSIMKSIGPSLNHSKARYYNDLATLFRHPCECDSVSNKTGRQYVFFVRDPLKRFLSAYLERQRQGAPEYFAPWVPSERRTFKIFQTPGEFVCALNSSDPHRSDQAQEALEAWFFTMSRLSDFMGNLSNVRQCVASGQFMFVGRAEHMDEDYTRLVETLRARDLLARPVPAAPPRNKAMPAESKNVSLGSCSVYNLQQYYMEDYQIIRYLAQEGFLPREYPEQINSPI